MGSSSVVRRICFALATLIVVIFAATGSHAQGASSHQAASGQWRTELHRELPLLGHRNWILIVDSAYPLQNTPGLQVIETHSGLIDVLNGTLTEIAASRHVRPNIFQDAELAYIPEADAKGITQFRERIHTTLGPETPAAAATLLPHEELIAKVTDAGKNFHILVLKTDEVLPFTSVFIQLDCKYWSADAEQRLRDAMAH
jgi:hypothetical protein